MTGDDAANLGSVAIPQTTVDLFELLRRQGKSDADLRRVREVCAAALLLFAGRFHGSGKVYIAHCMGTAGVLASLGSSMDLVVAGLLHGAFMWGDFGASGALLTWKRHRLRRVLGSTAEQYVHRFSTLPWHYDALRALQARLPPPASIDGGVVLMRLASELDNLVSGARFSASQRRESFLRKGPRLVEVASEHGFPALAAALANATAAIADETPPGFECSFAAGLIPPESSTKRVEARLARSLRNGLRWARQFVGKAVAGTTPPPP